MTVSPTPASLFAVLAFKAAVHVTLTRRLGRPWSEALLLGSTRGALGGLVAYLLYWMATPDSMHERTELDHVREDLGPMLAMVLLPLLRLLMSWGLIRLARPDWDRGQVLHRAVLWVGVSLLTDAVVYAAWSAFDALALAQRPTFTL